MTLVSIDITSACPELAVYIAIVFGFFFSFLTKLRGNINLLRYYMVSQRLPFLDNRSFVTNLRLYYFFVIFMLASPFVAFACWIGVLVFKAVESSSGPTAPLAVALVVAAIFFVLLARYKLEWKFYKGTKSSILLLILGLACFITYQIAINFLDKRKSFFGLSAVFLSYNGICILILIFLFTNTKRDSFVNYLNEKLTTGTKNEGQKPDIEKEIQAQEKDPNYIPTLAEISELYTVDLHPKTLLIQSSGIQDIIINLNPKQKKAASLIVYFASLAVLIGYAFIIFVSVTKLENKLGFVTAIATVTTDIFLYIYYKGEYCKSSFELCLITVIFRVCLFGFGGTWWFYGYCLLFFLFGCLVCWNIAERHFPFMVNLEKKQHAEAMENYEGMVQVDLSKKPEFLLIILTVVYALLVIMLQMVKPSGVPLPSIELAGLSIKFYYMAVISAIAVAVFFCIVCLARTTIRKKSALLSSEHQYFFHRRLDAYWIYIIVSYISVLLLCLLIYLVTKQKDWIVLGFIIPFLAIIGIDVIEHYVTNGYRVIQNIEILNKTREKLRKVKESKRARYQEQKIKRKEKEKKENDEKEALLKEGSYMPQSPQKLFPPTSNIMLDSKAKKEPTVSLNRETTEDRRLKMYANVQDDLRPLEDWSKQYNSFTAFWKGKLRLADYNNIVGIILLLIAVFALGASVQKIEYSKGKDNWFGVSLALPFATIGITIACVFRLASLKINMAAVHIIFQIIAVVAHFGYVALYVLIKKQGFETFNGFTLGLMYLFIIPMGMELLIFLFTFKKRGAVFDTMVTFILVVFCMELVGLCIFLWFFSSMWAGIFTLIGIIVVVYISAMMALYIKNKFYLPKGLVALNITLFVLGAAGVLIYSFVAGKMSKFVSFSITYHILCAGLLIMGIVGYMRDFGNIEAEPIIVSSWIFPIIKYDSKKSTARHAGSSTVMFFVVIFAQLLWSILLTVFNDIKYKGVAYSALLIIILLWLCFYLVTYTGAQFRSNYRCFYLNSLTKAWISTKKKFIEIQNVINFDMHDTFQELITKIRDEMNTKHSFTDYIEHCNLIYEMMTKLNEEYDEEIELLIYFQLYFLVNTQNSIMQKRRELFGFTSAKEAQLHENDIIFSISLIHDQKVKYIALVDQIRKLPVDKLKIFNDLKKEYEQEVIAQQEVARLKEEENKKLREEQLKHDKEIMEKKKAKKENEDKQKDNLENIKTCDLVDSQYKYQRIQQEFSDTSPFVEEDFKDALMIGTRRPVSVEKFSRPAPECKPFGADISAFDIKQGALGDCYFLSAIAVLGEERVKKMMFLAEEGWKKHCGAYCVLFYRNEEPEYTIIDDTFPMHNDSSMLFAQSQEVNELWPAILEKAYAHFHGSYLNIEAGFVHYALAELTGGEPLMIKLDDVKDDVVSFFNKLINWSQQKYLMGAGSNEGSDTNKSENGIVQGHAYSILNVVNYKGSYLINLRNPHGNRGAEWNGDWSDDAPQWDEDAKRALGFVYGEDGVFWMNADDFFIEYSKVYVCKIFDQGWTKKKIQGEFKGHTAQGLPNKDNPNCKCENNPQYAITVKKPCNVYIKLTQTDPNADGDQAKGKNAIYMIASNKQGLRLPRLNDKKAIIAQTGKPIALKYISMELALDNTYSYPFKFTVYCAAVKPAPEGEGKFILKVSCNGDYTIEEIPLKPNYIAKN